MGLRIGAARRIPTSTATVAARATMMRKNEGRRIPFSIAHMMP
jgi:hypothetical protein